MLLAITSQPLAHTGLQSMSKSEFVLIEAPSNLGLRPPKPNHEPGTWGAPKALLDGGLWSALGKPEVLSLERPRYSGAGSPGSLIRNGMAIQSFSNLLSGYVLSALEQARFPLVLGGDCSVLLGCLLGARRHLGRCGLIHIDGHSDFFNPDPEVVKPPYSAAGMDLALATGRGEALLSRWPVAGDLLVQDADVLQLGEREELDPDYAYPEIANTAIERIPVREVLRGGVATTVARITHWVRIRNLSAVWLHIDVDVLDQAVLPAVDSPGSPGLDFDQLADLLAGITRLVPVVGSDVTIFDPELDPDGRQARRLASCIARGFLGKSSPSNKSPTDPRLTFSQALLADGPSGPNAEELRKLEPLIGSWDLDVVFYREDGSVAKQVAGEWHFSWVLEGRAVQDVWIVPRRSLRRSPPNTDGEYGTTIRFYDAEAKLWSSTWIGPVFRLVWPFAARASAQEILLERQDESGEQVRWIFSHLTPNSFYWRALGSTDGGNTWKLDQEMFARRAQ